MLDSLFRIRDPWLFNLSRCEEVGTPEGDDSRGNMATGRVGPRPTPARAVVGYQALELGAQAEVVGPIGADSYEQCDGVPVGLVSQVSVEGPQLSVAAGAPDTHNLGRRTVDLKAQLMIGYT